MGFAGQAVFIAITADAPGSVAAHLSLGAVGIIEEHPVVAAQEGGVYDHQAVGADGEAPVAEGAGDGGEQGGVHVFGQVVEDDEVVSGSVHFGEAHREITFL